MVQIHAGMHAASCGRVVGFISAHVVESYPPSGEPTHPQCRFTTFGLLVIEFGFSVLPKTSFLSVCRSVWRRETQLDLVISSITVGTVYCLALCLLHGRRSE
jgi:hypothetical protein